MFRATQGLVITGGSFTEVNSVAVGEHNDAVSTLLLGQIASGAIFDSAERYPPGRCHPGTRQRMIDRILAWINNVDTDQHILWLYGPAGAGKSALAHTICELLKQHFPERYAGSFFFVRGPTDGGKGEKLFLTLAHELAVHFPGMRSSINDVLSRNPSLPTKSMDIQILHLIIQPLLSCADWWPSHTPTIIIDGLDECDEDDGLETQPKIITLIACAIVEHNVPIRFLIASRPEYWIRGAFEVVPLSSITAHLCLRDDLDADRDIRRYLQEGFYKIYLYHQRILGPLELPWPHPDIIRDFVESASGQYIYASTVLKFVGKSGKFSNPIAQLRVLTTPGPHCASAFTELDRLYTTILSAYPRRETLKRVLGGLLVGASLPTIEVFLGVDSAEIALVLDALSSLIEISSPGKWSEYELLLEPVFGDLSASCTRIKFSHLSFQQFLEDETRSGPFYVQTIDFYDELSRAFFGDIQASIDENYELEHHVSLKIGLQVYSTMMLELAEDISRSCRTSTFLQLVTDTLVQLEEYMLHGHWRRMCYPVCFMEHMRLFDWIWGPTEMIPLATTSEEELHCAISEFKKLQAATSIAYEKLEQLLSSSPYCKFGASPVLAFIEIFRGVPVNALFKLPGVGVVDTVSTLQTHRHILGISGGYYDSEPTHLRAYLKDPFGYASDLEDSSFFHPEERRNGRILLAHNCLDSIMNSIENGWESPEDEPARRDESSYRSGDIRQCILGDFFDSPDMADILSEGYFQNPYKIAMLALLTDSTAWTRTLPHRWQGGPMWETLDDTIIPALCWFNRQLKNPESRRLMESHDRTLSQAMLTTMKTIFEHCFLPAFTDTYFGEPQPDSFPVEDLRKSRKTSITHVQSLSVIAGTEDRTAHDWEGWVIHLPGPEAYPRAMNYIERIHEEIFRDRYSQSWGLVRYFPETTSSWFTHLATFFIILLVKQMHHKVNTPLETKLNWAIYRFKGPMGPSKFDMYIVECLPYTPTTKQNLNTFRFLRYLCSQDIIDPWCPPRRFCSRALDFLMKYKDSELLFSEELEDFKRWLTDLELLEMLEEGPDIML